MALITRLTRLFRADFHAVLDSIEEPDTQLKQAVREMQFELQQSEQKLALMQHEVTQLEQLELQLKEKIGGFNTELDICFDVNEDELARDLITRKLSATAKLETTNLQRSDLQKSCHKLVTQIGENRTQLDVIHQKLELLIDKKDSSTIEANDLAAHGHVRKEDIEIAFLREKQSREKS